MCSGLRIALLSALLAAGSAFADDGESNRKIVDVGFSGGLNSPAGVGVESIVRLDKIVALGAAAGYGSWGPKVSLIGRVHLENSIARGLFLEPSLSMNMGGLRPQDTTSIPPVGTFSVAGGYRWSFWDRLWVVFRVGQSFSFGAPANAGTSMPAASSVGEQVSRLMFRSEGPPGGWVLGLATGASI